MLSRSSPRLSSAFVAASMAAALAGACADTVSAPIDLQPNKAGAVELSRVYRLGVGDKIKLTIFGEPDMSGTYEVNAVGNVPVSLVGEVPAKGRGISEFRDAVRQKLSQGYLNNPKVSVEVVNFRPIYIHGEVRSGGEFPYKNGLKLRDAVALAGGFTYRANETHVILVREGSPAQVKVALPADVDVLPGDNIRVPERFF
ncbi:MAG: polysaccharide biosynthesis/export family protein [Hyphomicrobiaceae bacterium]